MNATVLVNIALGLLNQVLGFIAELKSQSGLSDDAILAEAQKITAGNDAAYAALVKALTTPAPAVPVAPVPAPPAN